MEYYEYSENKEKCNYWIVVESCKRCLFETLCRLQYFKSKQQNDEEII